MQHVFEQRLEGVGRGAVEVKRRRQSARVERKDGTDRSEPRGDSENVRFLDGRRAQVSR